MIYPTDIYATSSLASVLFALLLSTPLCSCGTNFRSHIEKRVVCMNELRAT
jgi:hypothetical protein